MARVGFKTNFTAVVVVVIGVAVVVNGALSFPLGIVGGRIRANRLFRELVILPFVSLERFQRGIRLHAAIELAGESNARVEIQMRLEGSFGSQLFFASWVRA